MKNENIAAEKELEEIVRAKMNFCGKKSSVKLISAILNSEAETCLKVRKNMIKN